MMTPSPQVDPRDLAAILKQARTLAPFYTPEWDANAETGAGVVLLTIAARMLDGLISRLNEVPRKNFVAFLDMLGVRLLPAQSARAPLTFFLSKGAQESVTIPARSQAVATPPGSEPIIFETERAFLATPAKLRAVFSLVPARDQIFDHSADLSAGTVVELFADAHKNRQEHSLYLAHSELFALKGRAAITLKILVARSDVTAASFAQNLSWEWWNKDHWVPSTVPAYQAMLEHTPVPAITTLAGPLPAKSSAVMTVTTNVAGDAGFPDSGLLLINNEIIAYTSKQDNTFQGLTRGVGAAPNDTIPGASVANFHAAGTSVRVIDPPLRVSATKNKDASFDITLTKDFAVPFTKTKINNQESFWIRCRVPANIQQLPVQNLTIDTIQATSAAPALAPDALFRNDIPLDLPSLGAPIYPFGRQPRTADTFYIASGDALSKTGAAIILSFDVSPGGIAAIPVDRVQGIGPTFADTLREQDIDTVDKLLDNSPEGLARILGTSTTRAANILEAAQKEFYDKTGIFQAFAGQETPSPTEDLLLSWEYWDGSGWQVLKGLIDGTNKLRRQGTVTFDSPVDIAPVAVNGQENVWIRVRIASGDYGREQFTFTDNTWKSDTSQINPPVLHSLTLSYGYDTALRSLEQCLAYDNLVFTDQTQAAKSAGQIFQIFTPLEAPQQALYLGFDAPPIKGPISTFFALEPQEYTEQSQPRLDWQYVRMPAGTAQGEWARLLVTDGTRSLTESGTIEFIGPNDFARVTRLGTALYWLRVLDSANAFQPRDQLADAQDPQPDQNQPSPKRASAQAPYTAIRPCDELITSFHPQFSIPRDLLDIPAAPQIRGMYVNTTWATQAETITNEILGSSSGSANQTYTLTKIPVIEAAIWVNESGALSEGERTALAERRDLAIEPEQDAQGNIIAFWVRWNAIDDLTTAAATDRVYMLDQTFGLVQFGDGAQGMLPPIGRNNIRATYQAGGGAAGNLPIDQITALRTTIPYVERVTNHEPGGGGANTESLDNALVRGPQMIRHRGRAVTREDFEWLARASSRAIARVKCLPTFNDRGEFETNWVTMIIVPDSSEPRPVPSPQLRQRVERYLRERAANVTVFPLHIQVTGPTYVEVRVAATLFPLTLDQAPQVEADALRVLAQFLHPLTGGYQGTGWEFGRLPCLSDFYALLEAVTGLDHVENLSMTLTAVTATGSPLGEPQLATEDRPLAARMPEYALVFNGTHTLVVKPLE